MTRKLLEWWSFMVVAWFWTVLDVEGHYCYYCGSSLDSNTRINLISQRVFTYPSDAMQTHCRLPYLLESGSGQLCDKPLCAVLTPSPHQPGFAYPGNFTILGCAELILRPSMVARIPLDAYISESQTICTEIEHLGMDIKLKFTVCFCNTNWCNTGDVQMSTSNFATATKLTVGPSRFTISPGFTASVERIDDHEPTVEGSGETEPIMENLLDGASTETTEATASSEDFFSVTESPSTESSAKTNSAKWRTRPDYSAWPAVKTTAASYVRDHKLSIGDEKLGKPKAEKSSVEIRRQQHTRDVNLGSKNFGNVYLWIIAFLPVFCNLWSSF